ncbi:MAG TPA: efflux RND transporter periplasmic adaptor subunit [Holophagaceae bacterium]|nr:efflux RND transporter periplasmic adaptor subunit [Holophagaceae bacterium]
MHRLSVPLLAALLASGLACGRKAEAPGAPLPTAAVRLVAPASSGAGWVAASLESREQAVLATRFAASVKAIPVHEGDAVKPGQLLAQLDDADLRGARDAAQAGLAAAQAQHARIGALAAQQAATQLEADQAATQLAQARAALDAAQANLRYTELRAPFPGIVRSRAAEPGAFVGPGQPILTLDGGGLELRASLSDAEAAGLKTGQELVFDVDGREGRARILALASGADPATHRRDLRATVLAPTDLRSGAFARIRIAGATTPAESSRWLPESALVRRGGLTGVFVVVDGRAVLRWLALGDQRQGRVEVRAGLKSDEPVVDQPAGLIDGQPVEAAHERR